MTTQFSKGATRTEPHIAIRIARACVFCWLLALGQLVAPDAVLAQGAHQNAVAEAADAFGSTVGREEVGLYSATSARGFDPTQAGNLRFDGLYFDQVSRIVSHVVRGSTVHVGISAQGFLLPAPTGVVDFQPRTLDGASHGTMRFGYTSYANQGYGEVDLELPAFDDKLKVGAGFGYSRNSAYNSADESDALSMGAMARWRPIPSLEIMPFLSMTDHVERGEKPHVFLGDAGFPEYRGTDLMSQPWADFEVVSRNAGTTVRFSMQDGWGLAAGLFRSESERPLNYDPLLLDTDRFGRGEYFISAAAPRRAHSTSGELRLSQELTRGRIEHGFYLNLKGRDRSSESGGSDTHAFGPGTLERVPVVEPGGFEPGPTTRVDVRQLTPGFAYRGVWADTGQLTLGVQKPFYRRVLLRPGFPGVSGDSSPWLYNAALAAFLSPKLVAYASVTRGFEEIGDAPLNAVNRGEAVAAQVTEQIDAGVRYRIRQDLFAVLGAFEIKKPYFDLDPQNVFRHVGSTRNRGIEVSLTGDLTDRLTAVAGAIFIDAEVQSEFRGTSVAVGPVPRQLRIDLQYRVPQITGLILDARIESFSTRYARPETVRLPSVTLFDVGARYNAMLFNRNATLRIRVTNIGNTPGLTPTASAKVTPFDPASLELSLAFDL